jgi:LacI family transcriptional regulator
MVGKNAVVRHWHVDVDNVGGARTMTQHLIRLGHRGIALLGGLECSVHIQERVRGYRRAMEEAGLEPHVYYCPYERGTARSCIKELLERRPPITALFVTAGDYTTDALGVLQEMGVRIPCDVALVAFDDHPHFQYFAPPLTVMKQPVRALGEAAVEMLFDLMEGREPEERFRVLPTSLVVRASCGASPLETPAA